MDKIDCFDGEFAFLSNFYDCRISFGGAEYANSEAAFQAMKCANPADRRPFQYDCPPNIAKRMGRTVNLRSDWEEIKDDVMRDVLYAKFIQHPELMTKLLATGDAELIEGNHWHDQYWGSCKCPKHKDIPGQNKLGKMLMGIRDRYCGWDPDRYVELCALIDKEKEKSK